MKMQCKKKSLAAVIVGILVLSGIFTGCGKEETAEEARAKMEPTILSIGGVDIHIGTTKLNELTSKGMTITSDNSLEKPLEEGLEMPGRTYDVGIYFGKDGVVYGGLQCLNDKEEPIPYIDSIINQVQFYYAENASPYGAPHYFEDVKIDGVALKGMTPDDVKAQFEGKLEEGEEISSTEYPGGEIAFLSFSYKNCYYSFEFDMETGIIKGGELEMFHANF